MTDTTRWAIVIVGGFVMGLIIKDWHWLPAIIFTVLMSVAYAYLFRKPKTNA